jgi:hypothetical protein
MTGYSDSKTPPMPPVESVAGYKTGKSPAAAEFAKGASNLAETQTGHRRKTRT